MGVSGEVSATNSLVGSNTDDQVGSVTILNNGNYVVRSSDWGGFKGAATWGSGVTGVNGVVSADNSLVGSTAGDRIGHTVTALTNGNYVVISPFWDNNGIAASAGAVTWGNGTTGIIGKVSPANSLVGSTAGDTLGCSEWNCNKTSVTAINNGNYVVQSPSWTNSDVGAVGAITLGTGVSCATGPAAAIGAITRDNSVLGINKINSGFMGFSLTLSTTSLWSTGPRIISSPCSSSSASNTPIGFSCLPSTGNLPRPASLF